MPFKSMLTTDSIICDLCIPHAKTIAVIVPGLNLGLDQDGKYFLKLYDEGPERILTFDIKPQPQPGLEEELEVTTEEEYEVWDTQFGKDSILWLDYILDSDYISCLYKLGFMQSYNIVKDLIDLHGYDREKYGDPEFLIYNLAGLAVQEYEYQV